MKYGEEVVFIAAACDFFFKILRTKPCQSYKIKVKER